MRRSLCACVCVRVSVLVFWETKHNVPSLFLSKFTCTTLQQQSQPQEKNTRAAILFRHFCSNFQFKACACSEFTHIFFMKDMLNKHEKKNQEKSRNEPPRFQRIGSSAASKIHIVKGRTSGNNEHHHRQSHEIKTISLQPCFCPLSIPILRKRRKIRGSRSNQHQSKSARAREREKHKNTHLMLS